MSIVGFRRKFDGQPIEPAHYLFWYITVIFGLAFTFLSEALDTNRTVLWQSTIVHLPDSSVSVWGLTCLIAMVGIGLSIHKRWHFLYNNSLGLAFSCWVYALVLYLIDSYWLGVLGIALPNMVFWGMAYLRRDRML